jgi:glucuronate isomerase
MSFIHEDFLLTTKTARRLYHQFAEDQPILDYHCHLPPKDVAENRRFQNLFEIWLEGDHYKWRAMRANGVRKPTAPATPRTRNFSPGRAPCRPRCAIRCITGRTWS